MFKAAWGMAFVFGLVGSVRGAGNGTHIEMGRRAIDRHFDRVDEMLPGLSDLFASDELRRIFYCACMFPDWGYDGGYHDAAEASHWCPFQKEYFEYLMERYPWPWDEEARRQIVFFLGALTHGVTDIPWHFDLDGNKSFQRMAGENDGPRQGNCEVVADVFTHVEHPVRLRAGGELWWPYEDLLEVLKRQGFAVSREGMQKGCRDQIVTWNLGATMSRLVYDGLRHSNSWTNRHYQDYCFGGIDHAAAVAAVWIRQAYARLRGWRVYQNRPTYVESFPRRASVAEVEDRQMDGRIEGPDADGGAFLELTGDAEGDRRRAFIRIGVKDIPSRSRVHSARLWLFLADRKGGEQTGDKIIEVCGVSQSAVAGAAVSSATIRPDYAAGRWVDWEVTPLVQFWIDNPNKNYGALLQKAGTRREGPGILRFYSSRAYQIRPDGYDGGEAVARRPMLVVILE